jgi:glycosyltransferase involved in cell wall biosynthesis
LACYGPGRPEKGSDVLQEAIAVSIERSASADTHFVFQWLQPFRNERGETVDLLPVLASHPQVEVIRHYFGEGEYAHRLASTQVMLLPYRCSSYNLRVSRVVIEAMVNGIPVVATAGTTLAAQAAEFGAVETCEDGSSSSLTSAIERVRERYAGLRIQADTRRPLACAHFSVAHFRQLLTGV